MKRSRWVREGAKGGRRKADRSGELRKEEGTGRKDGKIKRRRD